MPENSFKFIGYNFDQNSFTASFSYEDIKNIHYTEKIIFQKPEGIINYNQEVLDRALFLAFMLIGTSYYKSHPTKTVILPKKLDAFQADFFNHVYQEGLSQFAFENGLTREDLAHFIPETDEKLSPLPYDGSGIISLQSGGKDSLLTAELLREKKLSFSSLFITSGNSYPKIIDSLNSPLLLLKRSIDLESLRKSDGKNGHIPITYIVKSLALIQAILLNKNTVITSIGQEGNEAHTKIGDLPVNHQWSKTWEAEQLFAEYVHSYISESLQIGSLLRPYTELYIAEQFAKKCWPKYGTSFSSCNVANYNQLADNSELKWCANCAKCANTFLLFMPFLPLKEQERIFGENLLNKPSLTEIFKGLLGIDNIMKPFECVGEVDELRKAYEMRNTSYGNLPFDVPASSFNYKQERPCQAFIKEL